MKIFLKLACLLLIISGCSLDDASMEDPKVKELLRAAETFDRKKYGFSSIVPSDQLKLQNYSGSDEYDIMLHVNRALSDSSLHKYSKIKRTVSFENSPNGYRWNGEQVLYIGPNQYLNDGRKQYEVITLNYEIVHISGLGLNKLYISYAGTDERLSPRPSLEEIMPILTEWGYEP